jgi:hypothetical protein
MALSRNAVGSKSAWALGSSAFTANSIALVCCGSLGCSASTAAITVAAAHPLKTTENFVHVMLMVLFWRQFDFVKKYNQSFPGHYEARQTVLDMFRISPRSRRFSSLPL